MIKLSMMMSVIFALGLVACSSDDDNGDGGGTPPQANSELNGEITENTTLDPATTYQLTGTFTVRAGAELTIPAGTRIVANPGTNNYILVEQDADIQINGTEANPVVMTSSAQTPGDWGGLVIAGNATTTAGIGATAEVGGVIYGGTDDADDSGSINYLVINYAGAQINADSQYNGLTLYAVGSGTNINNVAMLNGTDDGVEFFGGTVSATNVYLENNEDDAVDWTEGWNGTITNTYVLHTIDGFSTAVEADKENANPRLVNFTAVSTTGGTALQFKVESGATITGLSLTGYDTSIDFRDDGAPSNVMIDGEVSNPDLPYNNPPTVDATMFNWATNASVEATVLQGTISGTVTLDASLSYDLTSSYIVPDGAVLNIPAGTKITARDGGTSVYIAVLKGGEININGTPDNPVVMSSINEAPGDWGGLTICGDATTTAGVDAVAEVGGFIYGGTNDADSSGSITNLVILGTGAQINADSQYNGVSLYAVGTGTTIENVAVINGADDGVEFFGGTVSATNIYLENNEDDAVDWTEGWSGGVTNTYVSHTIDGFSTAVEADKLNNNPLLQNFTAISTTGGTALQFKVESGATINNLFLMGYDDDLEFRDNGNPANVQIDGMDSDPDNTSYNTGTQVDISGWTWRNARL